MMPTSRKRSSPFSRPKRSERVSARPAAASSMTASRFDSSLRAWRSSTARRSVTPMRGDLVRRLIRMVRPSPGSDLEGLVRRLVSRRSTRACLNLVYGRLSPARKETFYSLFAKIFRDHPQRVAAGEWRVRVGDRWAALPLDGQDTWLEWDLAVSLLGHEVEIKQTYLDLIRFRRPKLFYDI